MSFQKLLLGAATAFCLVGASGAAMAVNTCPGGLISGIVNEDVIVDGEDCDIDNADISGDVLISNSKNVTITRTKVEGNLHVDDSAVVAVLLSVAKNIRLRNNFVALLGISIANRKIVVNRNDFAVVKQNGAIAAIICKNNDELDERGNNTEGDDECGGDTR